MQTLQKKILVRDKITDFEKIFKLLKEGYHLSLVTIEDFDGLDQYVLFLSKPFEEGDQE